MTNPSKTNPADPRHRDHMITALSLARRGVGNTWPNPSVGCVLVRDGRVVGRGWTQPGGRPHAETVALARAGEAAAGATAYVTLEPCNHHGGSPPCTEAFIKAGIAKVYAAITDPDERVLGTGIQRLQDAGITTEIGLEEGAARQINEGFLARIQEGRPFITLKTATTLDGKIATRTGESQWITGPVAREAGHFLRAENDAILVGSGTVAADDPTLTSRLPGIDNARRPRIVLDSRLRLPHDSNLVKSINEAPLWLATKSDQPDSAISAYENQGATVIRVGTDDAGLLDLNQVMTELADRGLTRILVEGGGILTASLLKMDLVDQIGWFRAPALLGDDGRAAIDALDIAQLIDMRRFERIECAEFDGDGLEILARRR
ncbi:MAG: bifunctional diaminohydroxyphosphoribosylaminopyrimidine deaminase/5-amino-6-(5-phosphoribosylamino)uracil reductase RibD [Rhodospirillaceae bacterium]